MTPSKTDSDSDSDFYNDGYTLTILLCFLPPTVEFVGVFRSSVPHRQTTSGHTATVDRYSITLATNPDHLLRPLRGRLSKNEGQNGRSAHGCRWCGAVYFRRGEPNSGHIYLRQLLRAPPSQTTTTLTAAVAEMAVGASHIVFRLSPCGANSC